MKKIFIGIFLICGNTLSGSSFDAITKFLSSSSFMWYHYYSIGNIFGLLLFLIFISFNGGIKKHLILRSKSNYTIPVLRGLAFIPIPIIVFFALKYVPLNIFTSILITTPFFIFIFSKLLQKEKISIINWLILLVGFAGAILVIKPDLNAMNIFILLVFVVVIHNALSNVIVSKYSDKASGYGYTFYFFFPLTLVSSIVFLFDPTMPSKIELIFLFCAGLFLILSIITWTVAFHIAGRFSSIISPFLFTQILWASISGNIFFDERLDFLAILGISLIIATGTITILITPKKIN